MRVTILKDSTLTVTAGQTIDVKDAEVARLLSQGRVAIAAKKPDKTKK